MLRRLRSKADFGECSYVLSFIAYQESLLQTYRQFNFTFQSIVVAIAAAVASSGIMTISYSEWLRTTFIVSCMYLFSAQFGRIMQVQIVKRGKDVNHWQDILKEVEGRSAPSSLRHYLSWLDKTRNPLNQPPSNARGTIARITQDCIDPIWIALAVILAARVSILLCFYPLDGLSELSAYLGYGITMLLTFLAFSWAWYCILRFLNVGSVLAIRLTFPASFLSCLYILFFWVFAV